MDSETKDEFLADLNRLLLDAGKPSTRDIERITKGRVYYCPRTSTSDLLSGKRRVREPSLIGFIKACDEYAAQIGITIPDDRKDPVRWQTRYQAIWASGATPAKDGRTKQQDDDRESDPTPLHRVRQASAPSADGRREGARRHASRPLLPSRDSRYVTFTNGTFEALHELPEVYHASAKLTEVLSAQAPWFSLENHVDLRGGEAVRAIREAARNTSGLLVMHFATHGVSDYDGELLLTFRDTEDMRGGVSASRLVGELLGRDGATALIFDTSYGGNFTFNPGREEAGPMWILSATSEHQVLYTDHTLAVGFADLLAQGVESHGDLLALGECVHLLRQDPLCRPRLVTTDGSDFVIAANAAHLR